MIDKVTWSHAFFEIWEDCTSELGLVDCSEPSVTNSDQGCVARMPLTKARLKGMKKFAVFYGLG